MLDLHGDEANPRTHRFALCGGGLGGLGVAVVLAGVLAGFDLGATELGVALYDFSHLAERAREIKAGVRARDDLE
ncbi:MAG: hypothetical protein U0235_22150 [Polyangiaceae bacterium]